MGSLESRGRPYIWRFANRLESGAEGPGRACEAAWCEAGQWPGRPQDRPEGPRPLLRSQEEPGEPGVTVLRPLRPARRQSPRPAVGLLHTGPAARAPSPSAAQGQKRPRRPHHVGRDRRVRDGGRSRRPLRDHEDTALAGSSSEERESRAGRRVQRSLTGASELRPPW